MFTPEFIIDTKGEYVLVASHSLENREAIDLSIRYNKARISFGSKHLPQHIKTCRIVYDIRGQSVPDFAINEVSQALGAVCTLEFKR
nr:hypothetical protein [uncultured Rhodoferax sp.]